MLAEPELGESADPRALVRGDPAAVAATVERLAAFAAGCAATARGLDAIEVGGGAAPRRDAFRARFAEAAGPVVAGGGGLPVRRAGVGAVRDRAGRGAGAGGGAAVARFDGGRPLASEPGVSARRSTWPGARRHGGGRRGWFRGQAPRVRCSRTRASRRDRAAGGCGAGASPRRPRWPRTRRGTATAGPRRGRRLGAGATASRSRTSPEGVGEGVEDARAVRPASRTRPIPTTSTTPAGSSRTPRRRWRARSTASCIRAPGGGVRRARVGLRPGAGVRPPAAHRSADGGHGCGPLDRPGDRAPELLRRRSVRRNRRSCGRTLDRPPDPSRPLHHPPPPCPLHLHRLRLYPLRLGLRPIRLHLRPITASVGTGSARSRWGRIAAARCGRSQSGASSTSHRAAHTFGRSDSGWGGR